MQSAEHLVCFMCKTTPFRKDSLEAGKLHHVFLKHTAWAQ
jgi:hypothetical protein